MEDPLAGELVVFLGGVDVVVLEGEFVEVLLMRRLLLVIYIPVILDLQVIYIEIPAKSVTCSLSTIWFTPNPFPSASNRFL
jgi:hypothetical protein